MRKSILHLIHGLTIGGAEADLIVKSVAMARRYEYSITICCLMRRGELAAHAETVGISVIGPLMSHRYDVLAYWQLRRMFLSQTWPLVHTHLFAANFIGCAVAATLPPAWRPLLIASEHAMAQRWGEVVLLADRRIVQRQAAIITVPSQAAAASYTARGIRPQSLHVMPNTIDIDRFEQIDRAAARVQVRQELDIPQGAYLLGTVCRLQAIKGLPVLLEAIQSLPVHLIVAGDGPERERLASIIHARALCDRVRLLGNRSDVPRLLAALDLFVLPSYSESFGIAVAEALLMETPVVATSVGGVPEVTRNEQYACLVPPGDVQALTNAIQWVMNHPDLAKHQAQLGREFIQSTMSIEAVAGQQHAMYQQVLECQKFPSSTSSPA
ncbi:MAG: glycosyltransferase [Anaerolineae bacterium]|nr:glycosyltransferase [Anaerolineae bacterium]